jgi:hypothetical protein
MIELEFFVVKEENGFAAKSDLPPPYDGALTTRGDTLENLCDAIRDLVTGFSNTAEKSVKVKIFKDKVEKSEN